MDITTDRKINMANRLSYSQVRLFGECGQKYKYYYIDRLRERSKSGALFFGSAIDKAIEAVLNDRDVDEKAVFDKLWSHQEINGKQVYLPECLLVVYASSDMDWDIVQEEDRKFLAAKHKELCPELEGDIETAYSRCATYKKQAAFRNFRENENRYYNICNWVSLRRKGYLMLEAHRKEVLPKITKVITTQAKIELGNGVDTLIGYADLVCNYLDDKDPIIFDYKTSSIEYAEDSAKISPQLNIYAHALGIKKVGFIVFRKGIVKNRTKICSKCEYEGTGSRAKTCTSEVTGSRCGGDWIEKISPSVDIQIITDTIQDQIEDIIINNVDMVNQAVRAGIFTRNFDSCIKPYGRCAYYAACFKKDFTELDKV